MKNFSLKDEYLDSSEHIKQNAKRRILLQLKPQSGFSIQQILKEKYILLLLQIFISSPKIATKGLYFHWKATHFAKLNFFVV